MLEDEDTCSSLLNNGPLENQSRRWLVHFRPDNFLGGEQICIPRRSVSTFLSGTVCRLLTSATSYLWLEQRSKPWRESTLGAVSFCWRKKSIPVTPKLLLWKLPHVSPKVSDKLLNEVQTRKQSAERIYWQAVTHQSICPTWRLWAAIKACSVSSLACRTWASWLSCRYKCFLIKWL